jgi:hypothetical protein
MIQHAVINANEYDGDKSASGEEKNKTTVVNPPAEKKESHTTIVNPSPATETKKEKTEINVNPSPSPH